MTKTHTLETKTIKHTEKNVEKNNDDDERNDIVLTF